MKLTCRFYFGILVSMALRVERPVVYVTRDIERALGMEPAENYFIISNDTPYGREVQKKYPNNVWLHKADKPYDTYELLQLPGVDEAITRYKAGLVVFQNTPRIERLAAAKGWELLNPSADLSREVEEKISQLKWLDEDDDLLPPHKTMAVRDVIFEDKKFVLQFNHAHTGEGTYIIDSPEALDALKAKFPDRPCKVIDFIVGPVFTVNAVAAYQTIVGNPSYQITGVQPFTDLPFSTVGNDWGLALNDTYMRTLLDMREIAEKVGKKLSAAGWRGLFGIDTIYDEATQKTYLLEINARQPASAAYESTLQRTADPEASTIFEAHISALLRLPIKNYSRVPITGAQIVKRVTNVPYTIDMATLSSLGLTLIEYNNTEHNKEIIRIQSGTGIMSDHNVLNELGQSIAACIKQ
jgi:hypothetical protein